ncbi:tyrosine-type recombinase/integrase [Eubacterium sp. An3]|uniref:tyrosine-type recombinase/integrase n=1 Tax=Eubacterium sp. An3 TaxID=1965628 RepID=UPI000B3AFC06|nr:tyrosine-type recombinase/integrase [Eubacterium sp. An3]OUO26610.1 hypothetical protein B5F87_13920 [Eubacterium sp. An3]
MRNIGNDHKVLLKEDVILLLHAARNEMEKAMIALAVGAGASVSEMAELKVEDFVPHRYDIKLYNKKQGKYRTVTVTNVVSSILKRYLSQRKDVNPYFFPARKPGGKTLGKWWEDPENVSNDESMAEIKISAKLSQIIRKSGVENVTSYTLKWTAEFARNARKERREEISALAAILWVDNEKAEKIYEEYRGKFDIGM